ncbi:hypothetical protein CGCS363_v014516 [Colletotrichum siamense]|uniref:uncharacterized protein n=1 Tax=Colletotrichum siamense TaxID=690259 RepID=UPI00187240B7|nr:uncharacterized protein CGCS363_v014516 [Colletotrichum siamense]KAF5485232.1 hypothetical protein CGCS363_v014516 [Colletotrichum siamense]
MDFTPSFRQSHRDHAMTFFNFLPLLTYLHHPNRAVSNGGPADMGTRITGPEQSAKWSLSAGIARPHPTRSNG